MGRTQPHGIAAHHGAAQPSDFLVQPSLCFTQPAGPAGQKQHSQARATPKTAVPGRFAPNRSERTILLGRPRMSTDGGQTLARQVRQ